MLPHTLADPFLMVWGNALYIFLESQSPRHQGKIIGYRTTDLNNYKSLGTILEEDHHLSYPFVFNYDDSQYLIPESESAGEVALYKFEDFPYRRDRQKTWRRLGSLGQQRRGQPAHNPWQEVLSSCRTLAKRGNGENRICG